MKVYHLIPFFLLIVSPPSTSQTHTIGVDRNGIEFSDGSRQVSAASVQNNTISGDKIVYVAAEFSNSISGDFNTTPHPNSVKVLEYNHELYRKLNANGAPVSTQQHNRFKMTKSIDSSSRDLIAVWNANVKIDSIELYHARESSTGVTEDYYKIKLIDAKIIEITSKMIYDKNSGLYIPFEEIHFVYNSIEYEDLINGTSVVLNYNY